MKKNRMLSTALLSSLLLAGPAAYAQSMGDPGAEAGDQFGRVLARGDFNRDGYQDLAVGMPYEDVSTGVIIPGPPITDAGAVVVIYGSSTGLSPTNRQFWRQGSGGLADAPEAYDYFGASLAAGDFNGDGFDDLAIGVPGETFGCSLGCTTYIPSAGAAHVIYGSATGLSSATMASQFWHQDSPNVLDAAEPYDYFGQALGAGDFNSDGRADLAVGVPGEGLCVSRTCQLTRFGAVPTAGAVNVIYGSASGLSATAVPNQFWHQDSPGIADTAQTGDGFGQVLTTGDFNGDTFADLAVGVPGQRGTSPGAGGVAVIYGSTLGLTSTNQFISWYASAESMGWSLAAADFNRDGYTDLAVGAPNRAMVVGGAGAVYVFSGTYAGLRNTGFSVLGQSLAKDSSEIDDYFGWSLAAGDFNGDGYPDLAVGAYREDVGSILDAGAVNVLYAASDGIWRPDARNQFWHQNVANVEDASEAYDFFGFALAAGDFNGDGRCDLAIGVPLEDLNAASGTITDAGAVNVIYGYTTGLDTLAVPDQIWTQLYTLPPVVFR